jgi:predicted ABC-type transport system involved in lysophospholipase L1 biosynthesis ATPase subunit
VLRLDAITVGETLRSVSLTVTGGEVVAVWSERPVARATLLRVAGGLERPDSGDVTQEGGVGLVGLSWPAMGGVTVVDQLALPLLARGLSVGESRVAALRELVKRGAEGWVSLRLDELDAGQLVQLAVMRVLIAEPAIVLFDDPTTLGGRESAVLAILRSARDGGVGVLLTTPDPFLRADRTHTLSAGVLSEVAVTSAQIIDFPRASGTG